MGGSAYAGAALHRRSPNEESSASFKFVCQFLQDVLKGRLQCGVTSWPFNYEVTSPFETFGRLAAWQISHCDLRLQSRLGLDQVFSISLFLADYWQLVWSILWASIVPERLPAR